jgi:hypothetical protein
MDVVRNWLLMIRYTLNLTLSWFKTPLKRLFSRRKTGFKLILTTDHGTINVKIHQKWWVIKHEFEPSLQTGRSLTYEYKDVYAVKIQKKLVPSINMSSSYIFAK